MRAIARRGEEGAIAALQHYLTQVAAGIGGALPLNFFVQLSLLLAQGLGRRNHDAHQLIAPSAFGMGPALAPQP